MDQEIWLLPLPYTDVYAWIGTAISALAALGSLIGAARKNRSGSSDSGSDTAQIVSSGVSALGDVANSVYNQKTQFNNQVKLMNMANSYNAHSLHRAVEEARSVGISPLSVLGNSNAYQSATPTAPLPSMPSSFSDLPFKIKQMQLNEDSVKSQNDVNSANAEYLRSLAKGKNLENTFFGDILPLKTQLTQAEFNNAIYLQGYYASHPELLNAVADKQKVLNDNLSSQTDVNIKQLEEIDSIIKKNYSDISLNDRKIAQSYLQDRFTRAQIQELLDSNLRENYTNVGYLIDKMKSVSNSDLPDDVKTDRLAMLRSMYDQASGNSRLRLQYQYDKNLQDAKIAGQSEQVDKYINLQHDQLDWQKTQFAWNKVFEVVDKVGDALIPFYEQKHGEDFQREMQNSRFEHEEKMQESSQKFSHDEGIISRYEDRQFKREENRLNRDQRQHFHDEDLQFKKEKQFDDYINQTKNRNARDYDSEEWIDDYGVRHKRYRHK